MSKRRDKTTGIPKHQQTGKTNPRLSSLKHALQSLNPDELRELRADVTDRLHEKPFLEEPQHMREEDRKAAYTLWLREVYHNRGFPGVIEETYRTFQHDVSVVTEYNSLNKYANELNYLYHSEMTEAIETDPQKTYVGAVLLTYSPDERKTINARLVKPQPYPGAVEQAIAEILPQLIFAIARIPTPEDIGKQTLTNCISDGQLLLIMNELFSPKENPATFDERRRLEFEKIWEYLEKECPGEYDRLEVQDRFNKIVKRTKEQLEKRIEAASIDITGFVK